MTYLSPHLPFPTTSGSDAEPQQFTTREPSKWAAAVPPAGTHLVISDSHSASATWAVMSVVLGAVQGKIPVVYVDFRSESLSSLETIARKLGTPLPANLFTYLAPSPLPEDIVPAGMPALISADGLSLKATYSSIVTALSKLPPTRPSGTAPRGVVVLDGLAELVELGISPVVVSQFVRAVLAVARPSHSEPGASVVSTVHADSLDVPDHPQADDLLSRLLRVAGAWWRISGLSSGRSADVSGEISSHPLEYTSAAAGAPMCAGVPRARCLQYRLESSGVRVFAKGTGRGYL